MSHEDILFEAIEKSIAGGFSDTDWRDLTEQQKREAVERFLTTGIYTKIIFSHDFARALWGPTTLPDYSKLSDEELVRGAAGQRHNGYQYHLQMMVIADDPLDYLGRNI